MTTISAHRARVQRLFALCKDALAAVGQPLDTRELARAVAEAKGLDGQDRVLRKALALSIVNVMARQAKRGMVFAVGKRRGVRIWAVSSPLRNIGRQLSTCLILGGHALADPDWFAQRLGSQLAPFDGKEPYPSHSFTRAALLPQPRSDWQRAVA